MWWISEDGKRQINLDNVCFMEATHFDSSDRDCVWFHYENRPSERVFTASLDEAKEMSRSIYGAMQRKDEERTH